MTEMTTIYDLVREEYNKNITPIKIICNIITISNFSENEVKLMLYKRFDVPFDKLNFTLTNIRDKQDLFRIELINKWKKCIITEFDPYECEACHIIPHSEETNYEIDNGLLLNACIHKSFDDYMWSINPFTNKVEVNNKYTNLSIYEYNGKEIFGLSDGNIKYLQNHYDMFKEKYAV